MAQVKLVVGEKRNGFYFPFKGKDAFFLTDQKRVTRRLLRTICNEYGIPDAPSMIDYIKYFGRLGTIELKETANGKQYHEIKGNGFGGYGHFLDENKDDIRERKVV